jgi:hypothetical protein
LPESFIFRLRCTTRAEQAVRARANEWARAMFPAGLGQRHQRQRQHDRHGESADENDARPPPAQDDFTPRAFAAG